MYIEHYWYVYPWPQVHRSNRGEQQTKVDLAGTLDAQRSARLLIERTISQPLKSYSKGNLSILTCEQVLVRTSIRLAT